MYVFPVVYVVTGFETNLATDGFFDAGMLLQALKKDSTKPADQLAQRRRTVGKKLALTEY